MRRLPSLRRLLRLRRSWRNERGAVMVIAAGTMLAMLGMAGLAIDVGSWYQTQRHAQSAADAAVLAGSQDLPSNPTTAATDASSYVTKNFPGATATVTTPYGGSATQIQVTVTTIAPSFFAKVFGINSANVSATAVGQATPGATTCSTPGNGCYAIFTSDSTCGTASSPTYGVTFNGSGDTVTGGVHSNGGIDLIGGSQTLGPTTYGNGANCKVTQGGSGDTFSSGPTQQAPSATWPLDYSTILTACGGSGQVACSGPGGTPAYCTVAQASFDFPTDAIATGNVYCAYGTGTKSDPSTWTGLIFFHSGSFGTSSSPLRGTWIGGTIEVGRASFLAAQTTTPTYPVFYAVGSGTCSSASSGGVCMVASGSGVNGAMFAPNGTIEFNGAGGTSNFLESKDVNLVGGSFTGNGPLDTGTTGSSASDALLQ
jgi:Flp pilus assembly protein TadG